MNNTFIVKYFTYSLIEIYSKSYGENPIVIQGAGAGKEVTARGVLTDILRLSEIDTKQLA